MNASSSLPVTYAVTTDFRIEIPYIRVRSVRINGNSLDIELEEPIAGIFNSPFNVTLMRKWLLGEEVSRGLFPVIDLLVQPARTISESCLDEFFEIVQPSDAAAFIQKYGPLVPIGTKVGKQVPFRFVRSQKERLLILLWIAKALNEEHPVEDVQESLREAAALGLDFTNDPLTCLSAHLSQWLLLTKAVLKPAGDRLQPTLLCENLLVGLYALVLDAIQRGSPWSRCTHCRKVFKVDRPGKRFCSESCQQVAKQRRYREQRKLNEKAAKGLHSKTKGRNMKR